jgi:hypothetical protein
MNILFATFVAAIAKAASLPEAEARVEQMSQQEQLDYMWDLTLKEQEVERRQGQFDAVTPD